MRPNIVSIFFLTFTLFCTSSLLNGQENSFPNPSSQITASDHPWDHGEKIDLNWILSADDQISVKIYSIYKSVDSDPDSFIFIGNVNPGVFSLTVEKLDTKESYFFKIIAVGEQGNASVPIVTLSAISPTREWFDGGRFPLFIITIIFCGSVIYWIYRARSGLPLQIRKIAGLEAVDEAVGRATEMGRSILFIPGIQDMNEIQTIAGLTVLSRVAKIAAEYGAKVEVPTSRSLVMTAARETVQAAFLTAGRPESYNQDLVYYVTDEQFGYVAYVQGMMVREKPAACFYMGAFFAESLILAETGNTIGAIQVAGTAMPAQLPFFVAACDYTLIGEEFFAASAYLSGEPDQLGSLKGQDIGKIIVAAGIIIGVTFLTLGTVAGPETSIGSAFMAAAEYLKSVILT
ncbi:MAG TPA: fibronectin type III domain-containing protein [Candidatus Marinimicrobia bacterium]|nr:fibronectin type III domain-containing protein [Candidatus Neomarinimicrobiota bacterium]